MYFEPAVAREKLGLVYRDEVQSKAFGVEYCYCCDWFMASVSWGELFLQHPSEKYSEISNRAGTEQVRAKTRLTFSLIEISHGYLGLWGGVWTQIPQRKRRKKREALLTMDLTSFVVTELNSTERCLIPGIPGVCGPL